ncbi:hypothetical protein VTN96DRAFT_1807 [Rasamsonia emersonii]
MSSSVARPFPSPYSSRDLLIGAGQQHSGCATDRGQHRYHHCPPGRFHQFSGHHGPDHLTAGPGDIVERISLCHRASPAEYARVFLLLPLDRLAHRDHERHQLSGERKPSKGQQDQKQNAGTRRIIGDQPKEEKHGHEEREAQEGGYPWAVPVDEGPFSCSQPDATRRMFSSHRTDHRRQQGWQG